MPMWSEVSRRPLSLTWMGRRLWVPAFAGTTATPAQNVGNGGTHLLRLAAIRATLGPPGGLSKSSFDQAFGFQWPWRAFRAARLFRHSTWIWIRRVLQ